VLVVNLPGEVLGEDLGAELAGGGEQRGLIGVRLADPRALPSAETA
jgi:hypothetical protein